MSLNTDATCKGDGGSSVQAYPVSVSPSASLYQQTIGTWRSSSSELSDFAAESSERPTHKRSFSEGTQSMVPTSGHAAGRPPALSRLIMRSRSDSKLRLGSQVKHASRESSGRGSRLSQLTSVSEVAEGPATGNLKPSNLGHEPTMGQNAMKERFHFSSEGSKYDVAMQDIRWDFARYPKASVSLSPLLLPAALGVANEPTDTDEQEQFVAVTSVDETLNNIATVATVQHMQATQGTARDAERTFQVPSMLFQYRPYNEQAPLYISQADVAAVIEAVKGERPGSSTSPDGPCLASVDCMIWGKSLARGSMANVCGSLLMKVVMDLWLQAGPAKSFPVVLEMLLEMIYSEDAVLQERAFNIVYNLSLHAQLLNAADPCSMGHNESFVGSINGWQQHDTAYQSNQQCTGAPASGSELSRVETMELWLRKLLFSMLSLLHSTQVHAEPVWSAALGTLLHLTTTSGTWNYEDLGGLRLDVVHGFLDSFERYSWSSELYCQLIRLATFLMYGWDTTSEASKGNPLHKSRLRMDRVVEFGGTEAVVKVFLKAPSPEARNNLFSVLLDIASLQPGHDSLNGDNEDADAAVARLIDQAGLVEVFHAALLSGQTGSEHEFGIWIQGVIEGRIQRAERATTGTSEEYILPLAPAVRDLKVRVASAHLLACLSVQLATAACWIVSPTCMLNALGDPQRCETCSDELVNIYRTVFLKQFSVLLRVQSWNANRAVMSARIDSVIIRRRGSSSRVTACGMKTRNRTSVCCAFYSLSSCGFQELWRCASGAVQKSIPESLGPMLEATRCAVAGKHLPPTTDISRSWCCLHELLWAEVQEMSAIGSEWLYQLLVCAAERHAEAMWDMQGAEEGLALLPAIHGGSGSKWKGITQQPRLSTLLTEVLGPDCPSGVPVNMFFSSVARLLQHLKVRYSDGGPAVSDLEQPRRAHSAAKVSCSVLATLEVAVEWILYAPTKCRQPALMGCCELLLSLLCVPSHLQALHRKAVNVELGTHAAPAGERHMSSRALPQMDNASIIHAFLSGGTSVPHSVLKLVPLGLLVRLFDNLLLEGNNTSGVLQKLLARGTSCSDIRSGVVDWSFTSPVGHLTGTLRSALLLLVIGRSAAHPTTLKTLGGDGWFHRLLHDHDPNVRYYAAVFLLKRLMCAQPSQYHKALHRLLLHAQQTDDQDLVINPYLQMSAMLEMKLIDG
mmetsp:Transcript_5780/g.16222  ORF Transcript_5780/g.16222 Transcript_5780/m.16222 type:complete len:1192 (-) Transcript_5780:298-3873(-)